MMHLNQNVCLLYLTFLSLTSIAWVWTLGKSRWWKLILVVSCLWFLRHRHLPKPIYKAASLRRVMADAERRKEDRRRAHSAPGSRPKEAFRKKRIIQELEWALLKPTSWICLCIYAMGSISFVNIYKKILSIFPFPGWIAKASGRDSCLYGNFVCL